MTAQLLVNYPIKNFTIPETLVYAALGFVLVVCVLIFLMFFIKLLSFIVQKLQKRPKKATQPEEPQKAELAPGSSGEIRTFDVPDREAAMVMAIVADEMKVPLNTLNFISIKEVKDGETK